MAKETLTTTTQDTINTLVAATQSAASAVEQAIVTAVQPSDTLLSVAEVLAKLSA